MSCAETPAGGKDVALEPEDEAVALALEKDEAELAEEVDGGEVPVRLEAVAAQGATPCKASRCTT